MATRISQGKLIELKNRITERDEAILKSLEICTFLLTGQIQRLHNTTASTETAALRATNRELKKLKEYGLIRSLKRRIGGERAGSSAMIWHLSEAGYKLLHLEDEEKTKRRRKLEPSVQFLNHTLAVSECYVQLHEICKGENSAGIERIKLEPGCWRPYRSGNRDIYLKPDLFAITKVEKYEDRWFVEVDLDTESPTAILAKCDRYKEYFRSNIEQRTSGVFPIVLWIVPDKKRKEKLVDIISDYYKNGVKFFLVIMPEELANLILNGYRVEDLL